MYPHQRMPDVYSSEPLYFKKIGFGIRSDIEYNIYRASVIERKAGGKVQYILAYAY